VPFKHMSEEIIDNLTYAFFRSYNQITVSGAKDADSSFIP